MDTAKQWSQLDSKIGTCHALGSECALYEISNGDSANEGRLYTTDKKKRNFVSQNSIRNEKKGFCLQKKIQLLCRFDGSTKENEGELDFLTRRAFSARSSVALSWKICTGAKDYQKEQGENKSVSKWNPAVLGVQEGARRIIRLLVSKLITPHGLISIVCDVEGRRVLV